MQMSARPNLLGLIIHTSAVNSLNKLYQEVLRRDCRNQHFTAGSTETTREQYMSKQTTALCQQMNSHELVPD